MPIKNAVLIEIYKMGTDKILRHKCICKSKKHLHLWAKSERDILKEARVDFIF